MHWYIVSNSTEVKPVLQLMKNSHESSSAVEQLNNGQNVTEEGEAEDAAATTETCDSKSTSTTCQVDATCASSQLLSTDMICSSSSSQLHPLATTSIPSISGAGETVVEALNWRVFKPCRGRRLETGQSHVTLFSVVFSIKKQLLSSSCYCSSLS